MESEEKYMETLKATVECIEDKYFVAIKDGDAEIRIPMSEDKANDVKSAFNKLLARIKVGAFQIKLDQVGDDLFSQVANEYLNQLNREIKEVRDEMKKHSLVQDVK